MVEVNKVNTPIEELGLDKQSKEFQEKFWNYFYNVPYIQSLVNPKRKYAKDCPRDPRFKDGRIIVDLENPHILENMDYFRKTAITFEKTGKFTELKPNPNPNSEYYKWLKREIYRCYFGMVRPSDGEYVTGDMYFYMNYMEMQLAEKSSTKSKRAARVYKMPKVWDGVYYYFHYIEQAREEGLHSGMLSSRGRSKSYIASSMLAKRFKLGESPDNNRGCTCYITASDKKFLVAGDQTLDKFQHNIDFISQNTEWPGRQMLSNRLQDMLWTAGYKDLDLGNKGTGNSVVGISSNNDEEKLRGTRAVLYVLEEAGSFARLNKVWANILPSVEQGQGEDRAVYGQIIAYGCCCAGTKVWASDGNLKNIEDVQKGDYLLGFNGQSITKEKVTWLQPIGYKKCVRIKCSDNQNLECSIDHPLMVLVKNKHGKPLAATFKRANELTIGDTLLQYNNIPIFGNKHVKDAYLLGMLFGDGSYSGSQCVTLSITTPEVYNWLNENYDIGISKLRNTNSGDIYAQIYFRGLHPLLKQYGMDKQAGKDKKLPIDIDEWDKESISDFIGGYFEADGNVKISKGKYVVLRLTCKYKQVLEQIQTLLHKFNINSSIIKSKKKSSLLHSRVNNREYRMSDVICYDLYIEHNNSVINFKNNIYFKSNYKQSKLNKVVNLRDRTIVDTYYIQNESNQKGTYFIGKPIQGMTRVIVKSIEDIGIQKIYNLTADTTHTYLTNGFVSHNTSGDKDSDFKAFANMLYHPKGFHIKPLKNVYDIEGKGGPIFSYFYPAYMNNEGCYDKDGNSDVTKALFQILKDRENVKNNSSDINAAMKRTAEYPIVPQEAILKIQGNRFPIEDINERIVELESNPHEYDDTLVGTLIQNPDGTVKFKPTEDNVIMNYPLGDNKAHGALQIFKEPEKDANDRVYSERYVIGHDPINQDDAESKSLASLFVIDMWTESIAAEYTGRQDQENVFELGRLLCIYYNALMLYESNNKMCYSYFSKMNCTYMLADTPEYLRERDIVKSTGYGNAHPYTEKVLTPNGWMLWKDIKIGDYVYGSDGYPTKVIDIPFDDEVDCYKITLRDGRCVECSSGHLFNVLDYNKLRKLLSVKQMIDKGIFRVRRHNKNNTIYKESKFYIPVNPCIEYEEKHVDINPYFLGLMIGDGCFVHSKSNKCYFTSAEKDFAVYYSILNYPYKKVDDRHYKVEYPNFGFYAEKYGLKYSKARDKFIPDIYKYNSKHIRLELIQGLFDTDGTTNSMETSYTTVSRQLGLDVMEVLRSLGINCNIRISYNEYGPIYSVVAYTSIPLFKLPRKRNIQGGCRSRHTKIGITNIQYIGKKRAKCITVENSDGLYLISDFILTHNSAKGISATTPMNNHEDDLIEQWLKLPKTKYETNQEGEEVAVTIRNVRTIRNLALLKELSLYGVDGNYDRIRALGITLVLRNAYIVKYGGNIQEAQEKDEYDVYNDDFFKRNR